MATVSAPASPRPRSDASGLPWWGYSAFFMGAQTLFGVYVLAVLLFDYRVYRFEPYLSPFYSPALPIDLHIAGVFISPAFFIVWSPLLFRASCYYYRKAYYRAFFAPPACAMPPPGILNRIKYTGEKHFPWVVWNLHRFFLYTAIINVAFLLVDAIVAFNFGGRYGIGLGTLILVANVIALSSYTFSCHSFRHLVGGSLDCYSCGVVRRARYSIWQRVSMLNERHGLYALISLFFVWGADIYVRLLGHGIISDPHIVF
jgi:hypothetical protein